MHLIIINSIILTINYNANMKISVTFHFNSGDFTLNFAELHHFLPPSPSGKKVIFLKPSFEKLNDEIRAWLNPNHDFPPPPAIEVTVIRRDNENNIVEHFRCTEAEHYGYTLTRHNTLKELEIKYLQKIDLK